MISESDKSQIRDKIAPLLRTGDLSLLVGAGFSIVNTSISGTNLPSGNTLIDLILAKAGKERGQKTTLKDAYQLGKREIEGFDRFLAECFTVSVAQRWQEELFCYPWSRIYTTNIDNVLNVAYAQAEARLKPAGDFKFYNYTDPSLTGELIGTIPVVSIHGTCLQLDKGFVFSGNEYAAVSTKVMDWHRDLAAKCIAGGLVVVGNQLDESDLDVYIATRKSDYASDQAQNWIA